MTIAFSRAGRLETVAVTDAGGATAGGLGEAALRARMSPWTWLVVNVIVPCKVGRHHDVERFRAEFAANQASGPAEPSPWMHRRFRITEETMEGLRCIRVAPRSRPAGSANILYIHGGGYVYEMIAPQWAIVAGLVEQTGAEVIVPIYALAPAGDVIRGLDALSGIYGRLVPKTGNAPALVGDSAGAGLALALAHRLRDNGRRMPPSLLLYFPFLDATCSDPEQPRLAEHDLTLSLDLLREGGRMWAGPLDPADPRVSPLFADQRGLPPTLVLAGGRDLLVADATRFAALCPEADVRIYPGMFHGWVCAPIREGRAALRESGRFLAAHFA